MLWRAAQAGARPPAEGRLRLLDEAGIVPAGNDAATANGSIMEAL